jgi:c-di-GMP-binding flagellar brake protein YcgR
MTTNRRLGDRRSRPRFEIVGQLWGALETVEPLELRDISRGGALLESRLALSPDSVHRLRVAFNDLIADIQARVRHVRSVTQPTGDRYLIGLEFLHVQQAALERIDELVTQAGEHSPTRSGHVAEA